MFEYLVICGAVWVGLEGVTLLGEVCHWKPVLRFQRLSLALCFLLAVRIYLSLADPAAMLSYYIDGLVPLEP